MKSEKVRRLLSKFLKEVSYQSVGDFEEKYRVVLDELGFKLSEKLTKPEEVNEYLNFVVKEIDSFNKFLKTKRGREKVPYSQLFYWANKDKRLSTFLFEKGIEKRLSEEPSSIEPDMAGFEYKEGSVKEDEVVLIHEDDVYGCVFMTKKRVFFFSPAVHKIIVQNSRGMVSSYREYISIMESKGIKYITLSNIFNSIAKKKANNESSMAFKTFYLKKLDHKRNKK